MKNCEYYQQMLSDLHDDASTDLPNELKTHLKDCSACEGFYQFLKVQSEQLQNLPISNLPNEKNNDTSIITKIWKTNISIPLPAAAAVFAIAIGLYWFTGNNRQVEPQIIEVQDKQPEYQNVQFVKFSSQSAILVVSNE